MPKGNHKSLDEVIAEKEELVKAKVKADGILLDISEEPSHVQLIIVVELLRKLRNKERELKNAPA